MMLLCTWLFAIAATSHAAHSRRRPVVRQQAEPRYDRSITTFSSNGRLKQVEYGMEASKRGETVACFCTNDVAIIVASSKVYRLDAHVYLFTCGLVGDGRALAGALRTHCQEFRLQNGEAPTVQQISNFAAQLQHDLTRLGGGRPLGCTALIAGVDSFGESSPAWQPRLFQTDPGGIVEQCRFCAAGKGRDKSMEFLGKLETQWLNSNKEQQEEEENGELSLSTGDLALEVAAAVLKADQQQESSKHGSDQDKKSVHVWILQPSENGRGKTQATCVKNVSLDNMDKLRERFSQDPLK